MSMQPEDLSRRFMIDAMASGHCSVRERSERSHKGSLPVFSTNTAEEAKSLLVLLCVFERDGSGYRAPVNGELEDLYAFRDKCRAAYKPEV